ncbi:hypothetical protein E1L19_23810 [Salmonella enterica subsp. enterica]|nr:hypothetical protein [Salmonella enterica subsp. enterica]
MTKPASTIKKIRKQHSPEFCSDVMDEAGSAILLLSAFATGVNHLTAPRPEGRGFPLQRAEPKPL